MTITDEAKQIRAEVGKLRPDKRRRYGDDLRRRILDWVGRAEAAGVPESECSKLIGVKTWRFTLWHKAAARPPKGERESLAMVRIDAPALPMAPRVVLVAPSGYRIEGLALDQLVALLRELS